MSEKDPPEDFLLDPVSSGEANPSTQSSLPPPAQPEAEHSVCSECAEIVPLDAKVCRFCGTTRLRDAYLDKAVTDQRAAYSLGRELNQLFSGARFQDIRKAIENPKLPLARGLLPREQLELIGTLRPLGHEVRFEIVRERGSGGVSMPWAKLGAVAASLATLGVFGLAAYFLWPNRALDGADLSDELMPSVVIVESSCGTGSGLFVGSKRVITNSHVICDTMSTVTVIDAEKHEYIGRVTDFDQILDVAAISVPTADGRPAKLGDAASLRRGDNVYAIGAPKGLGFTLSRGVVSHPQRINFGYSMIQTDASVNPGNSGGPLVDQTGRVVGVVSLKVRGEGLAYALPINYLYKSEYRSKSGEEAFVMSPSSYDEDDWEEALAKIQQEAEEEAEELQAVSGTVIPVAAGISEGHLGMTLLSFGEFPTIETVSVVISSEGGTCKENVLIGRWVRQEDLVESGMTERQRDWLFKTIKGTVHFARPVVKLRKSCLQPGGSWADYIEVEGAPEESEGVPIQYFD